MSWRQLFSDTATRYNPNPHPTNRWRKTVDSKEAAECAGKLWGKWFGEEKCFEMSQEIWTRNTKDVFVAAIFSWLTKTWWEWIPENWGRVVEGTFGYCSPDNSRSLEGYQRVYCGYLIELWGGRRCKTADETVEHCMWEMMCASLVFPSLPISCPPSWFPGERCVG